MSSDFPGSPKFLKGALVAYASQFVAGPLPNVILFQYNPAELRRSLSPRAQAPEAGNVGAAREDVQRVQGPPVETINLAIELDATDQLEVPDEHPEVIAHGLQPVLASLELLLHPPSDQLLMRRILAEAGAAQICLPDTSLVLFVWGPSRVLPVRLTSFSVTEEAFDQNLNPIRARVELGMQVLTSAEFSNESVGFAAYLAGLAHKESLAREHVVGETERILSLLSF